ncbi:TetR/AcrR family transcriptional regulator [Nocardia lijiangensis]|uniref:TetR/AcrR family transcriptional regulator n=1 Tax=Nocardia lijiangensis TaxID=299618 RepID=UPI000830D19A|nr:TetR/AcrR family transcriptional regulator [Nocardia lijiangensis]
MPLPRFTRLPADEQRRILDVAQRMFAEDGVETASYNQIIAAAGISKSSAYNYFDGREDLLYTALDDVAARLSEVLGAWQRVADDAEFWSQLKIVERRLRAHIETHPADLALIDPAFLLREQGAFRSWIADFVDNGIAIGLITLEADRSLLVAATAAVLRAVDGWGAAEMKAGRVPDPEQPWLLLRNLWGTPRP